MAKPYTDKKFKLGEPYASMLRDFCAANYNGEAIAIIREAVKEHIDRRLDEPAMKKRYEAARAARLGVPKKIVKLIPKGKSR